MIELESVEIRGFRGIREFTYNFRSGRCLLLYGLNGTGKSSLFQALAFAFTGQFPPISSVATPSPLVFRHKALHSTDRAMVRIAFTHGGTRHWVQREVDGNGAIHTSSSTPEALSTLEDSLNEFCFLTRQGFASMVDAAERDSWQRLTPLLGHEELAALREGLRALSNGIRKDLRTTALQNNVDQARAAVAQLQAALTEALSEAGLSECSPETVREALATILPGVPEFSSLDSIPWQALESQLPGSERAQELSKRLEAIVEEAAVAKSTEVVADEVPDEDLTGAIELAVALGQNVDLVHDLVHADFLRASQEVTARLSDERCPLCGLGPPDWDAVRSSMADRVATLDATLKRYEAAKHTLATYAATVASVRDSIERAIDRLGRQPIRPELPQLLEQLRALYETLRHLNTALTSRPPRGISRKEAEVLASLRDAIIRASAALKETYKTEQQEISRELDRISGSREVRRFHQIKVAVERRLQLDNAQREAQYTERLLNETEAVVAKVQALYDIVDRAESELSTSLLIDLETEVARIFKVLTDQDKLVPKIRVRTERGIRLAEIIIEDFYGLGPVLARDYLSEANRNTLGLAIYFAGILKRVPVLRVLLMDDVTHSADLPHRRGLANFIAKELVANFQSIVLTHDRHWYDRLKNTIPKDQWDALKLRAWSPDGLELEGDPWATLLQKAENEILANRPGGGNLLRQALEEFLDEVCERLRIAFPFRRSPNQIKLEEKRDRLERAIREAWNSGQGMIDPDLPAVRLLKHAQTITNLASHYGTFESWDINDLRDALDDVKAIVDLFTCKNKTKKGTCGQLLESLRKDRGQPPLCKRCQRPITL